MPRASVHDRHGAEARIPSETPEPVSDVLAEILQPTQTLLVAIGLGDGVGAAELEPRPAPRLVERQAGAK